ncbi:MAG: hypothetical protein E7642_04515 [Ruminococcaceae bacterium]|nr:hypothetical protein [Oscillospiraceae bacterium]
MIDGILKRQPDFDNNLLKILNGGRPDRATIFELFFSGKHINYLSQIECPGNTPTDQLRVTISAMTSAGYDHAACYASQITFKGMERERNKTMSLNGHSIIYDYESFEKYIWPDMSEQDYSRLEKIKPYLPEGMKLIVLGPGGVIENAMKLVGYDNLCFMLYEEPDLVKEIFDNIGSRLVEYYENAAGADTVGAIASNDDWGFNTQTFLSPEDMRKYVFPWHKRIVEAAHKHGKPALLHSCGYYNDIIGDIINDMQYDGRHSYEDNITPVEQAYEDLNGKIAILGGIDINFLATRSPSEVYERCRLMLERTWDRGGYALGSGNSIADYIPIENYVAMIRSAHEFSR